MDLNAGLSGNCTLADVPSRGRVELADRLDAEARSERIDALGRAAAQVVHELSLPISLITGSLENLAHYVNVLLEGARHGPHAPHDGAGRGDDPALLYAIEHTPEILRICEDGADRIRRLVDELRTFVGGQTTLPAPVPVDVAQVVTAAISAVTLARPGPRLPRVHRELTGCGLALGRADLLERALTNLIANAFDAVSCSDDPNVWVRLAEEPRKPAENGTDFIQITVRDNGPGIAPGDREQIFDAFCTTKSRGGGLGLGLAIVRDIVAAHGGQVGVAAGPPPGATFVVRLPRVRAT